MNPAPGNALIKQANPQMSDELLAYGVRKLNEYGIVTGGDSGIGRAVALAFAREGADVLISYLSEESDAAETARAVEAAGRKCVTVAGDISRALAASERMPIEL